MSLSPINAPESAQESQILQRLLEKVESIEKKLEKVTPLIEKGETMTAIFTDSLDEGIRNSVPNMEERLSAVFSLVNKLSDPAMIEKLNQLIELSDRLPGLISMVTDSVDESIMNATKNGLRPDAIFSTLADFTAQLSKLTQSGQLKDLINSGIFDAGTLQVVAKAGKAMTSAQKGPVENLGLFGMMRALRDPDVQHAAGFLVAFGKQFGKENKSN